MGTELILEMIYTNKTRVALPFAATKVFPKISYQKLLVRSMAEQFALKAFRRALV